MREATQPTYEGQRFTTFAASVSLDPAIPMQFLRTRAASITACDPGTGIVKARRSDEYA